VQQPTVPSAWLQLAGTPPPPEEEVLEELEELVELVLLDDEVLVDEELELDEPPQYPLAGFEVAPPVTQPAAA
jgi:hypothetical protein